MSAAPGDLRRVLVIKLGALGDMVQALAAMAEIRRAHPQARITLLTTPPYAELARASGVADVVQTDGRPKGVLGHLALFWRLRRARFQRVYDLQTSARSRNYFYAFLPFAPQWSGISPGASHRHDHRGRNRMHSLDRQWDQLARAGVVAPLADDGQAPGPDLSWAVAVAARKGQPIAQRLGCQGRYALLIPGASAGRPRKRWPVDRFASLARELKTLGLRPVVVGGVQEAALAEAIQRQVPETLILTGRTDHVELAALAAGAALAVGNDTGPTQLAAFAGAPTVVLFSDDSRPELCAPRAPGVQVLASPDLADLSSEEVAKTCRVLLGCA